MSAERPHGRHSALRRIGGGVLAVAVGLGLVILLLLFLNSRDEAHVEQSGPVTPGEPFDSPERYLGAAQVRLLRAGDVYLLYGTARAPAQLTALRQRLSGPPDPALEQTGQAVVLLRRAGTDGIVALSAEKIYRTPDPADPNLERFASELLGLPAGDGAR